MAKWEIMCHEQGTKCWYQVYLEVEVSYVKDSTQKMKTEGWYGILTLTLFLYFVVRGNMNSSIILLDFLCRLALHVLNLYQFCLASFVSNIYYVLVSCNKVVP